MWLNVFSVFNSLRLMSERETSPVDGIALILIILSALALPVGIGIAFLIGEAGMVSEITN